jgi:hypothetical protein
MLVSDGGGGCTSSTPGCPGYDPDPAGGGSSGSDGTGTGKIRPPVHVGVVTVPGNYPNLGQVQQAYQSSLKFLLGEGVQNSPIAQWSALINACAYNPSCGVMLESLLQHTPQASPSQLASPPPIQTLNRQSARYGSAVSGVLSAFSCGGMSFTARTRVVLADGATVPISRLRVGDKVLAADTSAGQISAQTVLAVMVHRDSDLYDLKVASRGVIATIHTTSSHLFWDQTTSRWVRAAALRASDGLAALGRARASVVGGSAQAASAGWMWDLTVSRDHDFYVAAGRTAVLVHNCGWTSAANLDQHYSDHGAEMGFESQAEYEHAAIEFMCNCDGPAPYFYKSNGVVSYHFNPATGEFGMTSDATGGIITYYGIEPGSAGADYVERQ